jgi:hypothetical protein
MSSSTQQFRKIQDESYELFKKKNADYGDGFKNYGTVGVLVRMGDKLNRFQNITNTSVKLVETESLRDTLIDLHNYAAMAIMLLDEEKNSNNTIQTCLGELSKSDFIAGC